MTRSGKRGRRRISRRGMSLIEVMVALTLLALLAANHSLLTMRFAQSQQQVGLGAYRSAVLGGLVNKYMAMPYDTLPVRTGCTTVAATATEPFGYTRCVTVTDVSATQRRVVITLAPATLTRVDTVMIRRAKNNVTSPLGT